MRTAAAPPAAFNEFLTFLEEIKTFHGSTIIDTRGTGSSLVLGDSLWGKLGTNTPQSYLGDSRPSFTNQLTRNVGREFLDKGKEQITFFLLNSGAGVAPAFILLGSGTNAWASGDTALQFQIVSKAIESQGATGSKIGSWIGTLTSADINYIERSISEIGISGGQLYIRDQFTGVTLGSVGSEMRVMFVFQVGS